MDGIWVATAGTAFVFGMALLWALNRLKSLRNDLARALVIQQEREQRIRELESSVKDLEVDRASLQERAGRTARTEELLQAAERDVATLSARTERETSECKANYLADVVNRTLHDLVIRCTKASGVQDYYHVGLIGYGVGRGGVTSVFHGPLARTTLVPVSQIAAHPLRIEQRQKLVPGETGLVSQLVNFPVWLEPRALNDTPMCAGLQHARQTIMSFVAEHPRSFPPVILHVSDGGSTDGDPRPAARALTSVATADGSALLFNCHLFSREGGTAVFPDALPGIQHPLAHTLFSMSSELPTPFVSAAKSAGLSLNIGARGFVFNADASALAQFFDIGTTRPSVAR